MQALNNKFTSSSSNSITSLGFEIHPFAMQRRVEVRGMCEAKAAREFLDVIRH